MRLTFRTTAPLFRIVTSLRAFTVEAKSLAAAREYAPGFIIPGIESVLEVTPCQ